MCLQTVSDCPKAFLSFSTDSIVGLKATVVNNTIATPEVELMLLVFPLMQCLTLRYLPLLRIFKKLIHLLHVLLREFVDVLLCILSRYGE